MFRRALTYQLILAVAVGPLLCCCTTGRLLAAPAPRPAAPAPTSHAPSGAPRPAHSCCSHKHKPAKPEANRGHADPNPAPSEPGEKCPCKDGTSPAKTAQTETLSPDTSTVLRALTLDLVGPVLALDAACPAQPGADLDGTRAWNAAPLSTADLLFAHHNLRC